MLDLMETHDLFATALHFKKQSHGSGPSNIRMGQKHSLTTSLLEKSGLNRLSMLTLTPKPLGPCYLIIDHLLPKSS